MSQLELLVDHTFDSRVVRPMDERSHLRPEDALLDRVGQQPLETGDRLHRLHAVRLRLQTLVDRVARAEYPSRDSDDDVPRLSLDQFECSARGHDFGPPAMYPESLALLFRLVQG